MAVAVLIGVGSPIVGLYISYWANAASGATIVLVETGIFLLALMWKGGLRSVRGGLPRAH